MPAASLGARRRDCPHWLSRLWRGLVSGVHPQGEDPLGSRAQDCRIESGDDEKSSAADVYGWISGSFTTRARENSEVLPFGCVAVAVTCEPMGSTVLGMKL